MNDNRVGELMRKIAPELAELFALGEDGVAVDTHAPVMVGEQETTLEMTCKRVERGKPKMEITFYLTGRFR